MSSLDLAHVAVPDPLYLNLPMPTLEYYESEREAEEDSQGRQSGLRTGAMAFGGPARGSRSQPRVATPAAEQFRRYIDNLRRRIHHELSQMSTDDLRMTSGATHPERDSRTDVSGAHRPLNQPPRLARRRSHPDTSSSHNDDERHLGTRDSASYTLTDFHEEEGDTGINDYGVPVLPTDHVLTLSDNEDERDLDPAHRLVAAAPSETHTDQQIHHDIRAYSPPEVYSPSRGPSTRRRPPHTTHVTMQSSRNEQVSNQAGHQVSSADQRS